MGENTTLSIVLIVCGCLLLSEKFLTQWLKFGNSFRPFFKIPINKDTLFFGKMIGIYSVITGVMSILVNLFIY